MIIYFIIYYQYCSLFSELQLNLTNRISFARVRHRLCSSKIFQEPPVSSKTSAGDNE